MDRQLFWEIIEQAGRQLGDQRLRSSRPYDGAEPLLSILIERDLDIDELERFSEIFSEVSAEVSAHPEFAAIADRLCRGVSDDGLQYFARWVIVQGQAITHQAIDSPEILVGYVNGVTAPYNAELAGYAANYAISQRERQARQAQRPSTPPPSASTASTVESVIARGERMRAQVLQWAAGRHHPGALAIADDAPAYLAVLGARFDRRAERLVKAIAQLERQTIFFADNATRIRWRAETIAELERNPQSAGNRSASRQSSDGTALRAALTVFDNLQNAAVADDPRQLSTLMRPLQQLYDATARDIEICEQARREAADYRARQAGSSVATST